MLIGGAILVVAALLIFWPDGDSASRTSGAGARGNAAQANAGGGPPGSGPGGVGAREHDPAEGRVAGHINPSLQTTSRTVAPARPPKPEPSSFASAAEEIAYYEKRLVLAREDLETRAKFLERMKKVKEDARTHGDLAKAEARGVIVQQNYDKAASDVAELEKKLAELREKQGAAG